MKFSFFNQQSTPRDITFNCNWNPLVNVSRLKVVERIWINGIVLEMRLPISHGRLRKFLWPRKTHRIHSFNWKILTVPITVYVTKMDLQLVMLLNLHHAVQTTHLNEWSHLRRWVFLYTLRLVTTWRRFRNRSNFYAVRWLIGIHGPTICHH